MLGIWVDQAAEKIILGLARPRSERHQAGDAIGYRPALLKIHQVTRAAGLAHEIMAASRIARRLGPGIR